MPLQNRVDPFSRIHAVGARGAFVGNRGILHDHETRTLRKQTWGTDGWVICVLNFKSMQAPIMGKSHWTELFFTDEATALAAGHRPCFYCRRADASAFAACAARSLGFDAPLSAKDMSARLTAEMKPHLRKHRPEPRAHCRPADLPDGAMYGLNGQAFLKQDGYGQAWSFEGYGPAEPLPGSAQKLTPELSLAALRGGFAPKLHASAKA